MAMAVAAPPQATSAQPAQTGAGVGMPGVVSQGNSVPPKRSPAHYLWAVLIARIYEVFPLLCPKCGGQMRLIAFITEGRADISARCHQLYYPAGQARPDSLQ